MQFEAMAGEGRDRSVGADTESDTGIEPQRQDTRK